MKKDIGRDIPDFAVSVPADTISYLIKIIKGLDNDFIKVYKEAAHLYFKYKDTIIITKLVELRFPNYAEILISTSYDKKLTIANDKLSNLLKRVLIFSRTNNEAKYSSTYDFKLENADNTLTVSAVNEIAKIDERLKVNFEGEDLKIAFNSKYLLEFIQNIPRDKDLEIEFMYSNSAIKVSEKDVEDYIYILMPLALRD